MKLISFIFRHFIPIGLLTGVGLIVFNASTPPPSSRIDGIGIDLLSSPPLSQGAVEEQLNAIQQAGSEYVRIEVNWTYIETSQDNYDWSNVMPLDLFFNSAQSRGLKSVAVVTGIPLYLSSSDTLVDQETIGLRWEKFIQAAVVHFGEQVNIWQIGDQINSTIGSRSLAQSDPALYAKMLRSASKIIKNADSNDKVWMGSVVSAAAENCAVNPLTFLLEMNAAKAWNAADGVAYQPQRGPTAPENPSNIVNQNCSSTVTVNSSSIVTEVQSVQDLARQLGGKPVYITGLVWSQEDLIPLQANRAIDLNTLQSDMLVRASVMLTGANSIPIVFWQIDPLSQPQSMTGLTNLSALLNDSKSLGQIQGQSGSVQEFRFQKGADINLLAWRMQDGDSPQQVVFSGLAAGKMSAYAADASSLDAAVGTAVEVDDSGSTTILLNERPVIILGKAGGWDNQIKAAISDQVDIWRIGIQQSIAESLNQLKAAFLQWLEDLFNKAKDSAVDWGEAKINEILN